MDKGKEKLGSAEAYRKDHEEEMRKFNEQARLWYIFGKKVSEATAGMNSMDPYERLEIDRLEEEIWFEVWGKKFPSQ
jgi:hypothetical protein